MSLPDRHLAAILFTDIVGYTSVMHNDEARALGIIKHYNEALEESVAAHHGQILNNYGDGSLCSFPSAVEALSCAIDLQRKLQVEPVPLRIGIHIGEVIIENGKALGDGVNIASRIQSVGVANSILFSNEVYSKIKNRPELKTKSLGRFKFKNVDDEVEVFALSLEGLAVPVRNKMEGKLEYRKTLTRMGLKVTTALALLAAVGYLLYSKLTSDQSSGDIDKSIAVLPFVDMSSGKNLEYFGDGMAEEIINVLAQANDLKVISRTSSFQFKGKAGDLRKIGEMLGVATILEGSIRESNGRYRITAQLIKASDGTHLWSHNFENFEIGTGDVFGVQDEIASTVLKALRIKLSGDLPSTFVAARNEEAYKLYQQGRYFYDRWGKDDIPKAIEKFEASLLLDSTQALVWAYLASTQYHSGRNAKKALEKAIGLDPEMPEANIIQAQVYSRECKFQQSLEAVESALKFGGQNNPMVLRLAGQRFSCFESHQRAIQLCERSIAIDPLIANGHFQLGLAYLRSRMFEKAIAASKRCLYLSKDHPDATVTLALAYLLHGKPDSAIMAVQTFPSAGFKDKINVLAAFVKDNDQEFDSVLKAFETSYRDLPMMVEVYAFTGRKKEALALLTELAKNSSPFLADIQVNQLLDNLRSEDKFKQIVTSLNFPKF